MAQLRPFRALRFTPKAGPIEQLVCPPYDIISEGQRQAYLRANPHNIIRLELPKDGADPYAEAGKTLREWLADGLMAQDEQPAFYVYEIGFEIEGEPKSVAGLVTQIKLEEFSKGIVLPHEETLSKAKTDRFNLMAATDCNFSDIYSLYMGNERIPDPMTLTTGQTPLIDLTDESGLRHRMWAVIDPEATAAVQTGFADTKLYIADGHHRYETALNYRDHLIKTGQPAGDADHVMMMLVGMGHPGLVVFPTHRMIRDVAGFDAATLLAACGEYFDIDENLPAAEMKGYLDAAYTAGKKSFGFYFGGGQFTRLTLKDGGIMAKLLPGLSPASRGLDVNVLHTLVLERLLGIDKVNMANQVNLTYTRSAEEAMGQVDTGAYQACFILNPTRVTEIRDVAAAGEKMPQKSTYFYPKLITGLTMNKLR